MGAVSHRFKMADCKCISPFQYRRNDGGEYIQESYKSRDLTISLAAHIIPWACHRNVETWRCLKVLGNSSLMTTLYLWKFAIVSRIPIENDSNADTERQLFLDISCIAYWYVFACLG